MTELAGHFQPVQGVFHDPGHTAMVKGSKPYMYVGFKECITHVLHRFWYFTLWILKERDMATSRTEHFRIKTFQTELFFKITSQFVSSCMRAAVHCAVEDQYVHSCRSICFC